MSIILHSDLNNFYATCECLLNPNLNGKPVVVCGKIKDRHGIVLAKNYLAKGAGIKTGMTIYEATKLIDGLVAIEAKHDLYFKYSRLVKNIYRDYTDKIESFGIDEAWLDVTDVVNKYGSGENIANIIRERVKKEIGLTVSIGVSFNKVFAKLGSDMKKPDAVTVISKENFKDTIWKLPVEELLYVGRATLSKFNDLGIFTIGQLANFDKKILKLKLGKCGEYLYDYANGLDNSEVRSDIEGREIKSVGNSLTFYRDIKTIEDVATLIFLLADSVAVRMKEDDIKCARTVRLWVEDNEMYSFVHQSKLSHGSNCATEIGEKALEMFKKEYMWSKPIRALGVSVCDFSECEQIDFYTTNEKRQKIESLEKAILDVRKRYGVNSINRGLVLSDIKFTQLNINGANTLWPD